MLLSSQHQQCLAAFSRVKFTRVLLTVLIAFTKKEVRENRDWSVLDSVLPVLTVLCPLCAYSTVIVFFVRRYYRFTVLSITH